VKLFAFLETLLTCEIFYFSI